MNKKLSFILLSAAGFLTLASPTCEEEISPERRIEERLENLRSVNEDLVAPALTRRNLEAFESRAVEKLEDYADYLGMVSDSGLDFSFREQARENLFWLFLEGTAPESPHPTDIPGDGFAKLAFMIDSVQVLDPLEKENGKNYRGRLRYHFHTLGIHAADTILLRSSQEEMGMVLQKRSKEFGDKRLQVWAVQLTL